MESEESSPISTAMTPLLRIAPAAGAVFCLILCLLLVACGDCSLANARELERQGYIVAAFDIYYEEIQANPKNREALVGAAVALLMLGRFDEALVLQERAVSLDTSDVQTRVELGFNYLNHQRRPSDAVRVLKEAAILDRSAKILCFLAQAQVAAGDSGEAEQTLRQAIDSDATYGHAYKLLFELLAREGRGQEAQELANEAASRGVVLEPSS